MSNSNYKIHIALLGKETLPLYYLIKYLQPGWVYLLATKQNTVYAGRLKRVIMAEGIGCKIIDTVDAFDVVSAKNICEGIHEKEPEICEVTYNITGGTKPMAIGAYVTALNHKSKVYYTNSDSLLDLTTFEKTPFHIKVDTPTIFALQGQELQNYEVYHEDEDRLNRARLIGSFIRYHKKTYDRLRRALGVEKNKGQLQKYYEDDHLNYSFKDGRMTVMEDDVPVLELNNPDAGMLLFEGRWWEVLVADALNKWSKGRYEVWCSVTFVGRNDVPGAELVKNEVDILLNIGNKILFVECKSGNITQDNVYKTGVIRNSYGSDKSISILVSYYRPRPNIREKADDMKISVIDGGNGKGDIDAAINSKLDRIIRNQKA